MNENDPFESLFAPEPDRSAKTPASPLAAPWKVLLVDDEADIRAVFRLALQDVLVDGRPLQVLDAKSAVEAKNIFADHPDTALILLDVVMETEHAGLELVNHIRCDLGNGKVQIVVVTGQPGYAPLRDVLVCYEINGYCLKSELTVDKIFASVYAALRTFRTLNELEQQRFLLEEQAKELVRWSQIFEHAAWGIVVTTLDGRKIEMCNPAFAEQRGYTAAGVLQISAELLFTVPERDTFAGALQKVRETGHLTFESVHLRRDGTIFPVLVDVTAVKNSQGQMLYHIINVQDITEPKRIEEEKSKLETLASLIQKQQSLGRMSAAVAHHFNNYLAVVIGNLEMAVDDLPEDSKSAVWIAQAMAGAAKAVEVSERLRTYLGQVLGEFARLDLSETCRGLLERLQVEIPKNVLLEVELPQAGPVILGNADQIEAVVMHMVTNAIEAIEAVDAAGAAGAEEGNIRLSIKTVDAADIPAAHRYPTQWQPEENAYACLEIADTGSGIAKENIDKLFDPFFSTKFQGRGLGLSTAFGIVTAHRGAFAVDSGVGRGSSFRVFFPTAPEVPPAPSAC